MHAPECPGQEELSQYLLGMLPEEEADRVARHLASCTQCEATMDTLESLSDGLIERLRQPAPMDRYSQEPQCREALARAQSVGSKPPFEMSEVSEGGGEAAEDLPAADAELPRLGEYELIEELGRGGMGTVYRAMHTRLERQVALKVLPRDRMADPRAVARFEREMRAVGRLSHPNIVQATDARSIGGTHFLVMEYVEGLTLSEIVHRSGVLPIPSACEVVRQAALGLQCAHEHRLVHRDIKPSNLMLSPQGTVKVLDLGLARFQAQQAEETAGEEMTAANQAMGTADYMAPEQVSDVHSADIRADIYSLGCTLYKLLAGQPPFGGPEFPRTFDKMVAHVQQAPPSIRQFRSDLPDELVELIERMLAKSPEDRPSTPAEVAEVLVTFTAGCDLAGLLAGTQQGMARSVPTDRSLAQTDEYASSALAPTRPSGTPAAVAAGAEPQAARRAWRRVAVAAGLLALVGGGLYFGVTILIKSPGGQETAIHLPEGAKVTVQTGTLEKLGPPKVVPDGAEIVIETGKPEKPAEKRVEKPVAKPVETPVEKPVMGPAEKPAAKPAEKPTEKPMEKPAGKKDNVEVRVIVTTPEEKPGEKPGKMPGQEIVEKPVEKPTEKPVEPAKSVAERIVRQPLPSTLGGPLGRTALVAEPAPIEGVPWWTIETLGHRGSVYDVAYSPDGLLVATACADGVVRLWDGEGHTVVRMLVAYDGRVRCLAWSPDSSVLASAGEDWTIRLWDPKSGLALRGLRGHLGEVRALAFSPDGMRLASAAEDKTVRLWDVGTTKPPAVLRGHEADATCVAFSPDGRLVASGSLDKTVRVWDAETGRLKSSFTGHGAPVYAVAFGPSGLLLASAGASSQSAEPICLWNVADGGLARKLEGHLGGDTSLAFSPDGQLLAAGGGTSDPSVRIWDAGGGEVVHTLKKPSGDRVTWSVAFSPDGQTLAAGDGAGVVQFWEALSGRELDPLPALAARVRCVAFAPDEITLAAGYDNGAMRLFSTESGDPAGRFPTAAAVIRDMAFSPDARMLATSYTAGGLVDLWQLATGKRLAQVRGTRSTIEYLVWSADSKTLAAGNGTGKLWDAASGEPVRDLPSHGSAMAWSPDGATLAIAVGGDVRLFAGGAGRPTKNLFSSRDEVCSLAWSPDGKTLAGGNEDNQVYLWNLEQPTPRPAIYKGHKAAPVTLEWLDEGRTLVTGSPSEICFWATASGKLVRTIAADGTAVSPSGRLFATREGGAVRLRSLEDGSLVRSLVSLPEGSYLAVGPRGHYRASPETAAELVYLVQTDSGQQMLSPDQFAEKYGWKNDPALVQSWSD